MSRPFCAAARQVAADPANLDRLVALLGWLTATRHGPEGLRRAVRDDHPRLDEPTGALTPADRLDRVLARGPAPGPAVGETLRRWSALGVRAATVVDPGFPSRLAQRWPDLPVPPLLAWRGPSPPAGASVALVGARRASGYGTGVAAWLATAAADAGVVVVSGGAVGVDAAAHRAVCEAGGRTTVVLGCGHGVAYPRPHAAPGGLFDDVLAAGGSVLSEQLPAARPHPGAVRARNRILAGLADAVVVVEGGERSGALVTASAAADLGVPVLAVPGDVRAPGSAAPHRLLAEGAAPCTRPEELLSAVGAAVSTGREASHPHVLPEDVHGPLAAAWPRPLPVDDLAERSGRPVATLLGLLTRARAAGLLAEDPSGVRLRRAP